MKSHLEKFFPIWIEDVSKYKYENERVVERSSR